MKRWTLRIAIYLLLACVTTVAVAWGLALRSANMVSMDAMPRAESLEGQSILVNALHWSDSCFTLVQVTRARVNDRKEFDPLEAVYALVPDWTGLRRPSAEFASGSNESEMRVIASYGWPIESMYWRADMTYLSTAQAPPFWRFRVRGGFEHSLNHHPDHYHRAIPLTPRPVPFVIDTVFFGAIWFGIFFSFGSARRAIRKKRGRCPKCAYQLRGELHHGCSECGWGRSE